MIFARRALQRRLDELRTSLGDPVVNALAARLNRPGRDCLAATWETVVLHGLAGYGSLENETAIESGRRPDLAFVADGLQIVADITAVSDEGLDDANPYTLLSQHIERAKTKLGLPSGGVDLRVKSKDVPTSRGTKTVLRLPHRRRLDDYVRRRIVPALVSQIDAGEQILRVSIDDDEAGLDLVINAAGSRYSSGGYASYDAPKILDRNPLYNALAGKARQLRGATGVTGVIVGDADCAALSGRHSHKGIPAAVAVAGEFLRQYQSVDFVLLLTIDDAPRSFIDLDPSSRSVSSMLVTRPGGTAKERLETLFDAVLAAFPKPVMMPINAALRAREPGFGLGHHGGYEMEGSRIRMSSRELVEVLAGLRTLADNGAKYVEASRKLPPEHSYLQSAFLRKLRQGRLPAKISVLKTDENDSDDWIEFEFGDPDPAIAPLR